MSIDNSGRRDFLRFATRSATTAGAFAALPASIQRALAIPPDSRMGTIQDIEHIVIFMQENRSFDHYYGTMRGVRGFGDRNTVPLRGGRSVWQQRSRKSGIEVLPFHLDTSKTRAQCIESLDHGWASGHQAWNKGKYDNWIDAKKPLTMGYYTESDIPFQFALANAFTICDAYFCSVMGPTDPNRIYHWTGSVNPPGNKAGALIDNDLAEKGTPSWTTCPERLEKAGISWRVYQQGIENDSKRPFEGNYGDNPLLFFSQYIHSAPDSKLRHEAMSAFIVEDLARDVANNTLPQVSWVVAPEAYSEHPAWPPAYGAQYTPRVLDALTGNPKVWSKTVLFINYDENDGFFDHVVPPTPPLSPAHGKSTVNANDEFYHDPHLGPMPYGLGVRVPMIVVSPWTRGGWVCSQVFDHTSVLRFLEARHGDALHEPNITAWRRAVCGDLTSAFDFSKSDDSLPNLPDTHNYRETTDEACKTLPDATVPAKPSLPVQTPGTRPARPLPYRLRANSRLDLDGKRLWIDVTNEGRAGAVLHVYSLTSNSDPRVYTVEANKELSDSWQFEDVSHDGSYHLYTVGPNGFLRETRGSVNGQGSALSVYAVDDPARAGVKLILRNSGDSSCTVTIRDNAYGGGMKTIRIAAASRDEEFWNAIASNQWYDFSVTHDGDAEHLCRFAGHIENGLPSTSDPAGA